MSEMKHSHPQNGDPNGGNVYQGHRPYWTRAHHDWKFWVALSLMLAAMVIYVMSENLAFRPHSQAPQSQSGASGK